MAAAEGVGDAERTDAQGQIQSVIQILGAFAFGIAKENSLALQAGLHRFIG